MLGEIALSTVWWIEGSREAAKARMPSAPSVHLVAFPFSLTFSPRATTILLCVEKIPVQLGARCLALAYQDSVTVWLLWREGWWAEYTSLWGWLCFLWRMAGISVVSRTLSSCCREYGCYGPVLFNKRNLPRRIHHCSRTALFKAQYLDCFIVA